MIRKTHLNYFKRHLGPRCPLFSVKTDTQQKIKNQKSKFLSLQTTSVNSFEK